MANRSSIDDSVDDEQPLEFDMYALKDITIKCLKKQECISVKKLGEGCFNKVYVLTMDDGFECVARLALPYFPRYKTESEVATMQLVRERTSIRVPEVYAWSADATNPIGAEYILMEKIPGVPLDDTWRSMSFEDKEHIVRQIIDIVLQLFNINYDKIGGIYQDKDGAYYVGPIINDLFFMDERANMDLDRGPWTTSSDYLKGLIRSEIQYLNTHYKSALDGQDDSIDEDDLDDIRDTLSVSAEFEDLIPYFCPDKTTPERFCLHHGDLNKGNIMVEGTKVSGIIDWESSGVCPAWFIAQYPEVIVGRGKDVEESDADKWDSPEEFREFFEDTKLRRLFRSEMAKRDPEFVKLMDEGAKTRKFESKAIFLRDFPRHAKRWKDCLTNGSDGWEKDPTATID
ncbi:Phosphotransferase enzyme [Mortierella polycephala]|uniref:Phosphotransferase enzyme n=1 Tax=Mortierella polycephala TaxID=41804 RepID=A0A9P6Q712_9FUNG|nr:Phosphotransferase enzyme [Mortierella polycephala]